MTLNSRRVFIVLIVIMALALVACERPLGEEETPTPTVESQDTAPAGTQPDAGGEGETAPTLVPTTAAPGSEPAEGAVEQPAPEAGEEAPAVPEESVPEEGVPEEGAEEATEPEQGGEAIPEPEPTAVPPSQPTGEQVHIVEAGQNLFRISLQYGCTVNELAAYNGIVNTHYIYVGQVIRIPATCGG